MNKKKGFTLIELLAIIVILAIIAVITVPLILNIINDAQKNASIDSAYGYKSALEKYYMKKVVENTENELPNGYKNISELPEDFTVSGESPSDGWVKLNKGIVEDYSLKYDEYVVTKYKDKDVKVSKRVTLASTTPIPDDYKEVEYLESTGTQYIDTGYKPRTNSIIDVEFKSNKVSSESFTSLFGTQKSTNSNRLYCLFGTTNNIQLNMPTSSQKPYVSPNESGGYVQGGTGTLWTNDKANYKIDLIQKTFMLNDKIWNLSNYYTDTLIDSEYNLFILTRNTSGTPDNNMTKGKLYKVTIHEENSMIRNLLPVIRKSDNKPGMLDLANYSRNLLKLSSGSYDVRGVTVQISDDGQITMSGTATASGGRTIKLSSVFELKAGTYVMSKTNQSDVLVWINTADTNNPIASSGLVLSEDTSVYVGLNVVEGVTYNESFKIMLNAGGEPLPYEPYRGKSFYTNEGTGEFTAGPEL